MVSPRRPHDYNQYSVYASIPGDTEETREFVFGLFYHNWKDDGLALWVGTTSELEDALRSDKWLTGDGMPEPGYFYRAVDLSADDADLDFVEHIVGIARDLLGK